MKSFKYLVIAFAMLPFLQSCEKEGDAAPQRTTHVVTLQNNTGATGCGADGLTVTYLVSYRDIQVDVDIDEGRTAIINVLVEDKESINIMVQRTSDDMTLANTDIVVRTSSRPDHLGSENRRIAYCLAFDLGVFDF